MSTRVVIKIARLFMRVLCLRQFLFYPGCSVVKVCGEELQRLILHVHRHIAHSADGALVPWTLKLWEMQTLHQHLDGDGGGGGLKGVYLLRGLREEGEHVKGPAHESEHSKWSVLS